MTSAVKITRSHLEKKAVVYVRQSTAEQVKNNQESQRRQYNLKERAVSLGWSESSCIVIDDDLGVSGAHSENRPGYQRLISMVALGEVGAIFGIEISRFARNCLDLYQLLEIASTFGVLIGDEDAIYNPGDFNDRLLLGLKGTISEVELQQIKARMYRGRINKAKRGELYVPVPVGYEHDLKKAIRVASDESVRSAIGLVFRLFRNIGSVRAVLAELIRRGQELPYLERELGASLVRWRKPKYDQLYLILKNPFYAGTYVYGKRSVKYNPIKKVHVHIKHDPKDWDIVIPNHHEGYISMQEFDENQKVLKKNSFVDRSQVGAAREGRNLLQGLVYCGKCGRKMRSVYSKDKPAYVCTHDHNRSCGTRCNYAGAKRLDTRVTDLVLDVLNEGTVDLTFEVLKTQREELQSQKREWQKKIERLEYEEKLARRRYESVDPDNRLVASTLEKEWNQNLTALEDGRAEFRSTFKAPESFEVTVAEVKALLGDLPEKWRSGKLTTEDKKEIIRCVVEKISVARRDDVLDAKVHWQGGSITLLNIKKRLMSNPVVFDKVKDLAQTKTDEEIASILNAEEIKSFTGKIWTGARVLSFRISNKIYSAFNRNGTLRLQGSPYVTTPELGKMVGLNKGTVRTWVKLGFFDVKRGNSNKFWVKVDEQLVQDLSGSATKQPTDIPLNDLLARQEQSTSEIVKWAKSKGHRILRIKTGKNYKFFIRKSQNCT
jgi:DNA invertase Pin-like site-specific DNA recombinase